MWLLLRALDEQEDRETESTHSAGANVQNYYEEGLRLFIVQHNFAVAMSNISLSLFVLPLRVRRLLTDKSPIDRGGTKANIRRLRKVCSLLEEASPYVASPLEKPGESYEDKVERSKWIRLSSNGTGRGVFFASYTGGFTILVATYTAAWSLFALAFVPWAVSHYNLFGYLKSLFRIN